MIRYALVCEFEHPFEGWFSTSEDYDRQAALGLLACPACASKTVRKQIMAPAVAGRSDTRPPNAHAAAMEAWIKLGRHVRESFDYVGDRFAEQARAIHDGKAEARGIFGEASPAQAAALVAEGVPIAPLPPEPPKKTEMN
jgi:hypothetical protein